MQTTEMVTALNHREMFPCDVEKFWRYQWLGRRTAEVAMLRWAVAGSPTTLWIGVLLRMFRTLRVTRSKVAVVEKHICNWVGPGSGRDSERKRDRESEKNAPFPVVPRALAPTKCTKCRKDET